MTSSLRIVLATVFVGLGLVIATPTPAHACSCVMADTEQFVDWADVVFSGTVVDHEPPPERPVMSSSDPATYTFEVDAVYEGDVAAMTEIRSAQSGASCGLENIEVGRRYVVFASPGRTGDGGETDRFHASLCGGTRPASSTLVADVEAVTGPGRAPDRSAADDPVPLPGADGDVSDGSALTTLAVVGGGVLLLGAVTLTVRLRRH